MIRKFFLFFILGQLAKFCMHLPYISETVWSTIPLVWLCIYIYARSPYKIIAYLAAAIGFATHEMFFWEIGNDLGLEYYPLIEGSIIPISFIVFLLLAIFVHCALFICSWIVRMVKHKALTS